MFYQPRLDDHGMKTSPFKALVVPRPIAWITSLSPEGVVNLAPFSFFNAMSEHPPILCFGPGGRKPDRPVKDTPANIEATGEFVVNLVTWDLREKMNQTSATVAAGVDEMVMAGLESAPSRLVKPPRVAASPVSFECRWLTSVELPRQDPESPNVAIFGEVVGIHIADDMIVDGRVDSLKHRPIARMGYSEYTSVDSRFSMRRP